MIQVEEKDPNHPLDEFTLQQKKYEALPGVAGRAAGSQDHHPAQLVAGQSPANARPER